MDEFRQQRDAEPDRAWRALLLLTTAAPGLWERVRDQIDWDRMALDPTSIPVASYDEACLLRVAVNLLHGQGAVVLDGVTSTEASSAVAWDEAVPGDGAPEIPETRGTAETLDLRAAVDVRDMADNMDGALWRVVMLAWEEYQKRG